jgi:hypothetical protein
MLPFLCLKEFKMSKRTLEDIALETALGHFLCDVINIDEYRNTGEDWIDELDVTVWEPFEYYSPQDLQGLISDLESSILDALKEATENEEEAA